MPARAWEDLDEFLDPDEFADMATVTGRDPFPVIIDELYLSHDLGTFTLDTAAPHALCKEADAHGLKLRDQVTIAGVKFWLTDDPQPDGTGMANLPLSRSAT